MEKKYCQMAVDTPFNNSLLTYEVAEGRAIVPGQLFWVPLGKRKAPGIVWQVPPSKADLFDLKNVRPIGEEYDSQISLSASEMALFQWMSQYYHYPVGQLIFDCLPAPLKRPRPLKFDQGEGIDIPFELTGQQKAAVSRIRPSLNSGFSRWLVHGVTGSGKTFVYLEMIKEMLNQGKSVLFLLPEINLTPQFVQTFIRYLKAPIYSYHSSITKSDKYGLWCLLQKDDSPKVVIGVRSAIFLPLKKIGLVIVDEEHDSSFKQDDRCPYNARDIALKRASLEKFPVILGSATPSVEIYYQFKTRPDWKEFYLTLPDRIGEARLPKIQLVDMRAHSDQTEEMWPFMPVTLDKIKSALEKKEQVLVFVNRLGFAHHLQCRACGQQFSCPNCSVNLKYFHARKEMSCQYCNYKAPYPEICPTCGNMNIYQKGFGTERLQHILQNLFADKSIERFDRDEIKNFSQLNQRLNDFHQGKIDILVGTQMLSKGHNFHRVNLVCILGIDSQLNFPDFRANERVYQLLTQVSGRAGRFGPHSEVLVQTLGGENNLFKHVVEHSFDGPYQEELAVRQMCQCPPFSRLAMIYFTSKWQGRTVEAAQKAKELIDNLIRKHFSEVEILGPRPGLVEKRVNKFTWNLMVRSSNTNQLHQLLQNFLAHFEAPNGVTTKLDVDPYQLF
ncbi:MAG: primosomal protein N' [Pseudomonadota bacterium]